MGIKDWSDKASDYLDKKDLANPIEVINEALGGETREESKARRAAKNAVKEGASESVVKKAKGGMIGSASKRADGIAQRGKTRGKIC